MPTNWRAARAQAVYAVANNHFRGQAVVAALQLKHLIQGVEPDAPAEQPVAPSAQPPSEVTIGPAAHGSAPGSAPGSDPIAPRDRPGAAPAQPRDAVDPEPLILGIPESELKVDPRTLGIAPGEPLPPLLREGEFIRNRDARLIPTGERGYAVVILDPPADAEPDAKATAMIVAPNRMLESMEALQKDRGDTLRFTVTGQVHTYRGVNYLMVTSQPRPWLVGQPAPKPELVDNTNTPTDTAQDNTAPPPAEGDEDTSDQVLDQLLGQRTESPEQLDPKSEADDEQV